MGERNISKADGHMWASTSNSCQLLQSCEKFRMPKTNGLCSQFQFSTILKLWILCWAIQRVSNTQPSNVSTTRISNICWTSLTSWHCNEYLEHLPSISRSQRISRVSWNCLLLSISTPQWQQLKSRLLWGTRRARWKEINGFSTKCQYDMNMNT